MLETLPRNKTRRKAYTTILLVRTSLKVVSDSLDQISLPKTTIHVIVSFKVLFIDVLH